MSVIAANSHVLCRELKPREHNLQQSYNNNSSSCVFWPKPSFRNRDSNKKTLKRDLFKTHAFWPDLSKPTVLEMEPINDSDHLDQILNHAKDISQPILIDWYFSFFNYCFTSLIYSCRVFDMSCDIYTYIIFMYNRMASWCRKCIYLKPKLEKLAAEYDSK